MAKKKTWGAYDPSTLGEGFDPGGAMQLADLLGYGGDREGIGDMAHYGADFGQILGALQARSGMDQAEREAAIKLLLGQEGHQVQQKVADTQANASMYGADQGLAGHKYAADVSATNAKAHNENALTRAAMETQQRAAAAAQQAQARIQAAMLGGQKTVEAANIRNQGNMNVAAMKMLPDETRSTFAKLVLEKTGGDINRAVQEWNRILTQRPELGPFPGAPGGR